MQLITAALLAMVAGVPALPPSANQDLEQSLADNNTAFWPQSPCGGLMTKAVCCRKSILNLVDIGCKRAKPDIHTGPELAASCAQEPKRKLPRCCILGLLGVYGPCKPAVNLRSHYGIEPDDNALQVTVTDEE